MSLKSNNLWAHRYFNKEVFMGTYNILSIDGGGVKGLMPAIWLSALEDKVGSLTEHFDLILTDLAMMFSNFNATNQGRPSHCIRLFCVYYCF